MEKEEIEGEFHSILDKVADGVKQKLDITEAVKKRSSSRTAGKLAGESDLLERNVVDPVIQSYRKDLKHQFSRTLEAAADGADVEDIRNEILERDIFYQNFEGESKELEKKIIERFEHLHGVLQRLHDSEQEELWSGVKQEFSEEEAREFISKVFGFTEHLEKHRERFRYREDVKLSEAGFFLPISIDIDYTPEAIQVMRESEDEVREDLEGKLDEIYTQDDF
jgi:hypothetical protein